LRVQSWSAAAVSLANLSRTDLAGPARLTAGQCAGLRAIPRLIWPISGPGRRLGGTDDLCVPNSGRARGHGAGGTCTHVTHPPRTTTTPCDGNRARDVRGIPAASDSWPTPLLPSAGWALLRRPPAAAPQRMPNLVHLSQRPGCESSRPHGVDDDGDQQGSDHEDDSDRKDPLPGGALGKDRLRGLGLSDQQPSHRREYVTAPCRRNARSAGKD
jgi:hypothetical protein